MLKNDQIRQHGLSLNDAVIAFALPSLRDEFAIPDPALSPPILDDQKPIISLVSAVSTFANLGPRRAQWEKRKSDLLLEMKDNLQKRLSEGALVAFAHQLNPTPIRTHRKIPDDFWDTAEIDWESNSVSDLERQFHKVLIIHPDEFPEINLRPKIGRKSHRDKIISAIKELDAELDNFEFGYVHKDRNKLIRERIKMNYPELDVYGKNFGDDVIRKAVNQYFKEKH